MTPEPSKRSRLYAAWSAAPIIGWRMFARPLPELWKDWILLVALYWIFTVVTTRPRLWNAVTVAAMSFLLGIYVSQRVSLTLAFFGAGR